MKAKNPKKKNGSKKEDFDSLNLKKKLAIYTENWKYFLIASLVFFCIAVFYLKAATKIYQSTAKIKILDNSKELNISFDALSLLGKSNINLENEIEVLKSYRLLETVVTDLNLETYYYDTATVTAIETRSNPFVTKTILPDNSVLLPLEYTIKITSKGYQITNKSDQTSVTTQTHSVSENPKLPITVFPKYSENITDYIGKEYDVVIDSKLNTLKKLTDNLQIENIGKESEILSLSLTDKNKGKSEKIVNKIIEQFNDDGIKDRQLVSQRTIDFVNERFLFLSKELESIEENKKEYKKGNNLSLLEYDVESSIKNKSIAASELYNSETQLELAKFLKDVLHKSNAGLLPADIGIENAEINKAIGEYNKLVLEKQRLATSGGKKNPAVLLINNDIEENKRNIEQSIDNYNTKLKIELSKFTKVNAQFSAQFTKLPEKEKSLRAIERQQNIKESLYLLLLQKREEAAISLAITNPSVKIIDYAITNQNPVFPKSSIIYSLALLLNLLVPYSIINIKRILNTTISNKSDIEARLPSVPIVGEIPFLKDIDLGRKQNETGILSDVFNIICANINYILPIKTVSGGKAVFITSSIKGEGKTFSSINIAYTYASLGKKVLLIGADLRNPQIEKYLSLKKSVRGLSDYLHMNEVKWQDAVYPCLFYPENLDILASGSIPPNPTNLLVNGKFETLIQESKTEYDYVIVDTAPTLLVSDTKLISQFADAIIIITRTNHTEKELLNHIDDNINQFESDNVAIILNNSSSILNKKYNYGYEYGYQQTQNK